MRGETRSQASSVLAADAAGMVRRPVPGPAGPSGRWFAVDRRRSDAHALAELCEIVDACALEHARERGSVETESRLRGELVEELIAGEVVSRDSIVRRARLLGADLTNGAVAMIGTLQDRRARVELARRAGGAALPHTGARRARPSLAARAVDWKQGPAARALPTPPGEAGEEGRRRRAGAHLARRLLAATREMAPGLAVTLALSRHTAEPERLGAALDEAELALFHRRAPRSPWRRRDLRGDRHLQAAVPDLRPIGPRSCRRSTSRPSRRWCATTSSTRPSWSGRSRPTSSSTGTSPRRREALHHRHTVRYRLGQHRRAVRTRRRQE